jgi:hypothetical protein
VYSSEGNNFHHVDHNMQRHLPEEKDSHSRFKIQDSTEENYCIKSEM